LAAFVADPQANREFVARLHEYIASSTEASKAPPSTGQDEEKALERIDLETLAKKEDPQLDRIAKEVESKLENVESRLENKDEQNVVIPLPDTSAAKKGAPDVKLVIGKQSSTNPDVGSPLDEVNKLIQRVDKLEGEMTGMDGLEARPAQCPLCTALVMPGFRMQLPHRWPVHLVRQLGRLPLGADTVAGA